MATKTKNSAEKSDPVVERLDRIIELLERVASDTAKIPFKGIDLSKLA